MSNQQTNTSSDAQNAPQTETPQTFEAWLEGQDEAAKNLYQSHTQGLRGALENERAQRKDFEKQLRDATKKLAEGSDERKALEEMTNKLQELERQASFYEAATQAGVGNLRLAFIAAQQSDLFDKKGNPDFTELKRLYPELFTQARASANAHAGRGTGADAAHMPSMNTMIRRAAGRG